MSLVNAVVKFLSDAKPVSSIEELEEGRAAAEGVIRIGEEGPLISPVRGNHCVAFYYKAFHFVGSRTGQMMPRKLQTHEVYHSFDLEMTDGKIKAIPKKPGAFSSQDHKELSGVGYEGFRATEDLVSAGVRVRIYGTARKDEDGWALEYNKLEVVQPPAVGVSPVGKTAGKVPKKKAKSKAKPRKKTTK
jgi:hypothetical protein